MQLSFTIYVAERERGGEGREYLAQAAVIYSYKMKYSKLTLLERSVLRTRKELKSMPKTSWAFFTLSEWKEWMFLFDISPGFTCVIIGHFQPVISPACSEWWMYSCPGRSADRYWETPQLSRLSCRDAVLQAPCITQGSACWNCSWHRLTASCVGEGKSWLGSIFIFLPVKSEAAGWGEKGEARWDVRCLGIPGLSLEPLLAQHQQAASWPALTGTPQSETMRIAFHLISAFHFSISSTPRFRIISTSPARMFIPSKTDS